MEIHAQILLQIYCRPYVTLNSDFFPLTIKNSPSDAFSFKTQDTDKPSRLMRKSFANDENKNDRRAIRKPQLPSELRNSVFDVEEQRLSSANDIASFRQRARVLGRECFQACG